MQCTCDNKLPMFSLFVGYILLMHLLLCLYRFTCFECEFLHVLIVCNVCINVVYTIIYMTNILHTIYYRVYSIDSIPDVMNNHMLYNILCNAGIFP